jgi:hypothetical protein
MLVKTSWQFAIGSLQFAVGRFPLLITFLINFYKTRVRFGDFPDRPLLVYLPVIQLKSLTNGNSIAQNNCLTVFCGLSIRLAAAISQISATFTGAFF